MNSLCIINLSSSSNAVARGVARRRLPSWQCARLGCSSGLLAQRRSHPTAQVETIRSGHGSTNISTPRMALPAEELVDQLPLCDRETVRGGEMTKSYHHNHAIHLPWTSFV